MAEYDRDERRFLALREVLRLYAGVTSDRGQSSSNEPLQRRHQEADGMARIAKAVLGMDREDTPAPSH